MTVSLSQRRTESLKSALDKMQATTKSAQRCSDQLASRAGRLGTLTGPASDASSMLSHANASLAATLILMRDAREKFDTVSDCEPAIERLHRGVLTLEDRMMRAKGEKNASGDGATANKLPASQRLNLTEQDVYAAGDSMEILRDAYRYFAQRLIWRAASSTVSNLERQYKMGEDSMSLLISLHLKAAGQGAKPQKNRPAIKPGKETAEQTRDRLNNALQNRDLLKNIGEYDEYQPLEARPIREIRAMFECLISYGYGLEPAPKREPSGLAAIFGLQPQNISRTEKVGSGCYNKLTKGELKLGFPHLDAYGMSRREIAFASMDTYYRRLKRDRKGRAETKQATNMRRSIFVRGPTHVNEQVESQGDADAAARDAVRCLEHAMVVIAGEKNVYRTVVTPSLNKADDDEEIEEDLSPFYRKACVAAYSFVVGSVVDRSLDIIETVFLKEGGIGQTSGSSNAAVLTVPDAYSAAAAGLRMLDGVRMLGPSLAKLCEMSVGDDKTESNTSISAVLCIAIHRTTVKNCARTLENLAKAIQDDPMKGALHRPQNASVSSVSKDVVDAIRAISPFVSAYKSVSKRRALPWDPNMGEDAGEMDSFVRYLVMRLLNSLKGKALDYTRDGRDDSQAKAHIFMINNAYYLLEELGNEQHGHHHDTKDPKTDSDVYKIHGTWFDDKVNKMMDSEKKKYLEHWEALNTHLTAVDNEQLEFMKGDTKILSLESGRLIKTRFSGFNESFERTYELHKNLCIIDARLRLSLQQEVSQVFVPRYRRFFEKYTKMKFSKKKQSDYAKYSPERIEEMMGELYVDPEDEHHFSQP
mmetsp:Transcript_11046/g.30532  ORF Transcript_11046/g.30532 Transcript_11046/m.30532 type:complete len:815 (-) Transcript_11046:29-2473(-)